MYYRIFDPIMSVCNVENAHHSTSLLAATTLRNVLGTKNMSEILSERESIAETMQVKHLCGYYFSLLYDYIIATATFIHTNIKVSCLADVIVFCIDSDYP